MPLILRVDVDKPYGRSNVREKVLSKISENYWLPSITSIGYLNHLKIFLAFLSEERICSHIYFRKCTLPPLDWIHKSLNGHMIGLHAEDTRTYETLKRELDEVQKYFYPLKLTSFTKHGSGEWKSGRHHYSVYEPDKYLRWAETMGLPFHFGNEEVLDSSGFRNEHVYYPGMFWIDRWFHNGNDNLKWVADSALEKNVVVIIHPSNFAADMRVKKNMRELISLSRRREIPWITL